jgi:II/X family phage/plasmid replication protein
MAQNKKVGDILSIDTVVLLSPKITESEAAKIENQCFLRQGIDLKTGEIAYSITNGQLEGSYDHRIGIQIRRYEWKREKENTFKVPCDPYIRLEGSIHKAMMGHNIYGGTGEFINSCRWFLDLVSGLLNVILKPWYHWKVYRIDTAEVFQMWSYEHCYQWFAEMNRLTFPRRGLPNVYGNHGIYFPGTTTTCKFYHKIIEFKKHDKTRLKKHMSINKIVELENIAEKIIRCEVEIKRKKLIYDFGDLPYIGQITDKYINNIYDMEVSRIMQEGKSNLIQVREAKSVERRLFDVYKPRKAALLLGTWYRLSATNEKEVKENMPKRTFLRHKSELKKAGVAWVGTDILLRNYSIVPEDFAPIRKDIRRCVKVDPIIENLLKWYKAA